MRMVRVSFACNLKEKINVICPGGTAPNFFFVFFLIVVCAHFCSLFCSFVVTF